MKNKNQIPKELQEIQIILEEMQRRINKAIYQNGRRTIIKRTKRN